jgi:putative glutamine amidotransferase
MSAERARFELGMARLAVEKKRPVLGICGGLQVLNVALGGTLVQDIPTQVEGALVHRQETPATEPSHPVLVRPGTRLYKILDRPTLQVNSSHHQSPNRVAEGLVVSAISPDGVVEGLEAPDHPFAIGVQWHPEFLYREEKANERLFKAFLGESAR